MDHDDLDQQTIQDDPQEVHKVEAVLESIKASIQQNNLPSACAVASAVFPASIKSPQLKQQIVDTWIQIFTHFTSTEAFVQGLDHEQCASIMKYSYAAMKSGDKKVCDHCLGFQAHIIKKEGVGVVNRVFVERKL